MSPEQIFLDLNRGYSVIGEQKPIYVKHYSVFDAIEYSVLYKKKLQEYIDYGKPREEALFRDLIRQGKWKPAKDKAIKRCEEDISLLNSKKRGIKDYNQIHGLYDSIKELQDKRLELLTEKYSLIDDSAEISATKRVREQQIIDNAFYDAALTKRVWTDESFEYDYSAYFYRFQKGHLQFVEDFSHESLKQLCIEDFVVNILGLIEGYSTIFGDSPLKLSNSQLIFCRLAETYVKVCVEEPCDDETINNNAEKMLMWYFWKKNGGVVSDVDEDKQNLATLDALAAKRV